MTASGKHEKESSRENRRKLEREIADRQEVEDKLRESKNFLQAIFDAIQDGISVLEPEVTIIQANRVEIMASEFPMKFSRPIHSDSN